MGGNSSVQDVEAALEKFPGNIVDNRFYRYSETFEGAPPPGVEVMWGEPAESAEWTPITLRYRESSGVLEISYPSDSPFFAHITEHIDAFLGALGRAEAHTPFSEFTELSPRMLHRVSEFNDTARPFDQNRPIHRVIEERARRSPDAPALVYETATWSYRRLNEAANQLARHIRERYAPAPGAPVALYLDRDEYLLISALAVLKLGCPYVPLDLETPAARMSLILTSSRPVLLLTNARHSERLEESGTDFPIVAVDSHSTRIATRTREGGDLDIDVGGGDLAYVIHTSGTTGKPKGVAVEHRNFANIAADIGDCLGIGPKDRMLAVTTIAFDISTLEVFLPLMRGACVVLAAQGDLLDPGRLISLVDEVGVTVMQATPSLWQLVAQRLEGRTLAVRALCGGEALPPRLASTLAEKVDECWNVYGPTETTVWSTRHRVTGPTARVPIGRPVANTRCWILDERGRPLPPGVVGELYIGGSGVARGYLHDDELTASRFVPDPLAPGERMYRTGDLAWFDADGVLGFVGRNDFQVKLRGHRIELGEIESVLTGHPAVRQALVVLAEGPEVGSGDGRYLAAYYVPDHAGGAETVSNGELLGHLAASLPDHMVPSVLVPLPEMPLNVNGKIDRSALPDPESHRVVGHVAPETELETRLCDLWADVLGRGVGVTDDFFESGGNSILGILLVNRINSELGTDLKIRELFRKKSVRGLAPLVRAGAGAFAYQDFVVDGTDRERLWEPFPLTNVQQTYYLGRFNNFELSNLSTHVYTEFRYSTMHHQRLEDAFNVLLRRHHALRTVFVDGEQRFLPEVPRYRIEFHDLRDTDELAELRGFYSHKAYEPERYPLFDIVLSRLDGVYRLHVSFDAIIVDMTSFGVLFDEWVRHYREPGLSLPEPDVSYRDYVLAYERVRDSELLDEAQEYWKNKVSDYRVDLNLPLRTRPSDVVKPFFRRKSATIAAPVWRELLAKCRRFGISPTALVLEAYGQVLGRWSGQDRLCVNLTLFNRLPLHPDVNALVGDFTVLGLFDHRTRLDLSIAAKLRQVHDEVLRDIDNNLFDGVDVQRLLKTERGLPVNQVVAPAVLTSTLGTGDSAHLFELALDDSYEGVDHSISQTSQVWLDNKAYETADGFVAEWDYVDQLFEAEVVDAMHAAYCWTLERLAEFDWEADGFPVPVLPASDLALIEAANDHHRPRSEHTLVSLYESRLDEPGFAERVAVIDSERGERFNYGELHRDADLVTAALAGTPRGAPVGVLAEKGYLQAVATLGTMAAGAAYVPMNAEWPAGRVGEILAQAGVGTLLLSRAQSEREDVREHLSPGHRLLVLEDLLTAEPGERVRPPRVGPDDVAYVIFTSGSTGTPKGVTISHRGAVNTILAVNERFGVGSDDRVLALSELSFDLSVYDLFGLFAAGGTVVFPAQEDTRDPATWAELVERHGITLWNSVPQLAELLADEIGTDGERAASLRTFLLSGDWTPTGLPEKLRCLAPDAEVMSLGGATEGSIWSIWYRIGAVAPEWASIPYGVAMPNQRMYVLDASGAHCPVGVIGEIHIGGDGVALNYWGAPELTSERYVEHPELGRLYRTGDLGRWSGEGHIEFLGRDDFQVKLNGYRVELEEIGSKLAQLPGVGRAIASVQSDDGRRDLVGHLVPSAPPTITHGGGPASDKVDFLMGARGVLEEAEPRHRLGPAPTPSAYTKAKSYRRFLPDDVDVGLVRKRCADVLDATPTAWAHTRPGREDWAAVLRRLTAVTLPGRALPKYLYPSAGGTYSVRVFAGVAPGTGDLGGRYYHNPLTGELCSHELGRRAVSDTNEIALTAHWPAITPVYGDRSHELASIEAGHMLGLIAEELERRSIPFEARCGDERIDDENTVLCRIRLGAGAGGFSPAPLSAVCFTRDADGVYTELGGPRRFDLGQFSVFDRTTDAYAVMRDSRCLLTLEGSGRADEPVSAGFVFQRLRDPLHEDGLGTCVLGFNPTEQGVYTLAAGRVTADEVDAAQSDADIRDLTEVVNSELGGVLPGYMLPAAYSVLDELPLSPNGKIALDRLPALRFTGRYVEPATETERELARAWGRVLRQPPDRLSAAESFFSLGGNSLTAMRLVRELQRELGFDISLRELYELDTITALAERFGTANAAAGQEEGEL
ncbi:non-ribosomal peptide synthetase [Nocardiopsis kunsanensis]|uniref:non-ribosomal peptide synthetase n=1 Tax=Nocardiopsis kunsanensis TaxID=141693 RepID=UPI000347D9D6|nr:non-ribosomal peptide synthetase [Nocardiopsis kunsanensis]